MQIDPITAAGLIGLTLALSTGRWLDGLRAWLLDFQVQANPLRVLGETLSSTMCVGFCVGFFWGVGSGHGLVAGGALALAASVVDELLALMAAAVRRTMPNMSPPPMPVQMGRRGERPAEKPPGFLERPLTEEEAHQVVDAQDEA